MDTRRYWISTLDKIAYPVLDALSRQQLKALMPVEQKGGNRCYVTYLEALGRTLLGVSAWLEHDSDQEDEQKLIEKYRSLSLMSIDAATDPKSADYMNFGFEHGRQPIVDGAFLAHALIRAPKKLVDAMDARVKGNLAVCLESLRYGGKPSYCNWLLFSAMIETALYKLGRNWDAMRVDYAVRQMQTWYVGDGNYSDGPAYHWDYYNSYVIQPMLVDIIMTVGHIYPEWEELKEVVLARATRYAGLQERLVAPDGSFPVTGRSIAYRCGAFQVLAQMAYMEKLPETLKPAQARSALTKVIERTMEAEGTFDENGWLKIGLCGSQPSLGENYISTGSLYLCTAAFLPLGLSNDNEFWSGPEEMTTWQKAWSGMDIPADHAIKL